MTRLDCYLTDNSDAEDADYAFEQAQEALRLAVKDCGGNVQALAELLQDILGADNAAGVLLDYLSGDADELNDALMEWNR